MRIKARPQRLLPSDCPVVPFRPEPDAMDELLARHEEERAAARELRAREKADMRAKDDQMLKAHAAEKQEAAAWREEDPGAYADLLARHKREREELRREVWQMERRQNTIACAESRKRRREREELEGTALTL